MKNRFLQTQKNSWGYGITLVLLAALLIVPVPVGATPSVENISAGEPAVPMGEAGESDGVTRLYVSTSKNARVGVVAGRMAEWGDVIESEALAALGVIVIEVPTENLEEQMKRIRNTSGVRYVETEQYVFATDVIPNDPAFTGQYALTSIRAPQGWMYSTGEPSIVIAVLDSGVQMTHPDLQDKLVGGYDFVDGDSIPQDGFGHGTHVAGIAAASTNNGVGMAGVSWGARIMPVRVLNNSGGGTYENVALGIQWAVDNGAHVINLSLGGVGYSAVLESAVEYAYDHNVLMVGSAGNTGSNFVLYPARFPQVIAVGASNISNIPASFSNYGPEVELAAPGDTIYSALPGGYGFRTGTSMSAPHVSGLAAVLFGYVASADSVRSIMQATAKDIGPTGWDDYAGAGLIQMDAALAMVAPPLPTPTFTAIPTHTAAPIIVTEEEDGGGQGTIRQPAFFAPPLVFPSPTLTFTPLPTGTPASPTATNSPRKADAPSPTPTPTSTPAPIQSNRAERLKIFLSPAFCGAMLMILLGVWLLWLARKRKNRFTTKL